MVPSRHRVNYTGITTWFTSTLISQPIKASHILRKAPRMQIPVTARSARLSGMSCNCAAQYFAACLTPSQPPAPHCSQQPAPLHRSFWAGALAPAPALQGAPGRADGSVHMCVCPSCGCRSSPAGAGSSVLQTVKARPSSLHPWASRRRHGGTSAPGDQPGATC